MVLTEEGLVLSLMARIRADHSDLPAALAQIYAEVTALNADRPDLLSDPAAEKLFEEIEARRKRQREANRAQNRVGFFASKAAKPADPDAHAIPEEIKDESRTRIRRYLGRVASIPALFASLFTVGEQAVLSQLALQCRTHGLCALTHGMIAYRARCSERTVRNALSKAKGFGLIEVKRHSRMASVIRVVSQEWRNWWNNNTKAENKKLNKNNYLDPTHPAKTCQSVQNVAPIEVVADEIEVAVQAEIEEPAPKPVAPVTPTSVGHGPKATRKEAAPTLAQTLDRVLSTVPLPPRETLNRKPDEWDRPMVARACEEVIGPWMDQMGTTIELTGRGWTHTLRQGNKTKEVVPTVLDWLEGSLGRGKYAIRSFLGVSGRQIFIGFERREDGAAFREAWSAATAG